MINWDRAPHPEQKIDYYKTLKCIRKEYYSKTDEYLDVVSDDPPITLDAFYIIYESGFYIDTNQGWGSQTEPEPPAWEIWYFEELIVRPTMKCRGRGLTK